MTLRVRCPGCTVKLKIRESKLGKRVLCPGCKSEIPVNNNTIVKDRDDSAIEEDRRKSRSQSADRAKKKRKTQDPAAKSAKSREKSRDRSRDKSREKQKPRPEPKINAPVEKAPAEPKAKPDRASRGEQIASAIDPNEPWERDAKTIIGDELEIEREIESETLSFERWFATVMWGPRELFGGLLILLSIPGAFACVVTFMHMLPAGSYPRILLVAPGLLSVFLMSIPFYGVYAGTSWLAQKNPEKRGSYRLFGAVGLILLCVSVYGASYYFATAEERARRNRLAWEQQRLTQLRSAFQLQISEYQALYDNLRQSQILGKPRGGASVVIEIPSKGKAKVAPATLYLGGNMAKSPKGLVNLVCLDFENKTERYSDGSFVATQTCRISVIDYQRRSLVGREVLTGSIKQKTSNGEFVRVSHENLVATVQSLIPAAPPPK